MGGEGGKGRGGTQKAALMSKVAESLRPRGRSNDLGTTRGNEKLKGWWGVGVLGGNGEGRGVVEGFSQRSTTRERNGVGG